MKNEKPFGALENNKPLNALEQKHAPLSDLWSTGNAGSTGIHLSYPLIAYLAAINVTAFILYGVDKHRARKGGKRIPEKILFGVAVVGGSVGALAGMYVFRHKKRHRRFKYGLPAILLAHLCLAAFFLLPH